MTAPVRSARQYIAYGDLGIEQTLAAMAKLVQRDSSEWPIKQLAASIVVQGSPNNPFDIPAAIREWCMARFVFVPDHVNDEQLFPPSLQVKLLERDGVSWGDCDDAAMLCGALGAAVGCPVRFLAVGFLDNGGAFSHVWCELLPPLGVGGEWIECDITRQAQSIPVDQIARARIYPVLA